MEAGAVAFGVARTEPVAEEEWRYFEDWLARGYHAGMEYMRNYPEIRRDPRLLLEGAESIVSIAFNYRQANPYRGVVATYALGEDYHRVLRRRLKGVVAGMRGEFGGKWRICIDSAPVMERYWAEKCGVGVRSGVHGNIVVPGVGSMVFLAEIVSTVELPVSAVRADKFIMGGKPCCPTGALQPGGVVDSRRCINYLTIEHRGELDEEERRMVGGAVFGCDACQLGCMENQGAAVPVPEEFRPLPGLGEFLRGERSGFELEKSAMARRFLKK